MPRERTPRSRFRTSVGGRRETLLYLSAPGDLAAYQELRAGFTAAVSHELRTPLARLLVLLETADAPRRGPARLIAQPRGRSSRIGELIDDVLFLSELETGARWSRSGRPRALPGPATGSPPRSASGPRAPASESWSTATSASSCRSARGCCV